MHRSKLSPVRSVTTLFALLLAGLLIGACTPSAPQTVVETQVVTEIQTQVVTEIQTQVVEVEVTAMASDEIPEGGTLIFGTNLAAEFPINPVLATNRPAIWLFDTLVELDAATLQPAPSLAASWEVSDDGTVYTFTLRDDVFWHDGEPFDADDVVFTFDAYLNDPDSRLASTFTYDVGGESVPMTVAKIDPYTVEFTLPAPSSTFLTNLCCWNGIVPEHLLSGYERMSDAADFNENPVGTGVLIFEELRTQEYVRFTMNKDYWRGRPPLDGFIWLVLPDDDSQVTAMANGEMDVMKNVNSVDIASRLSEIQGVTIYTTLGNFTHALFFNPVRFEPFADQAVREAIAMAIDRPTIMNNVVGAPPADQIFHSGYWGFSPEAKTIPFDRQGAVDALAAAGWTDTDGDGIVDKDGQALSFVTMTERLVPGEAIQGYLAEVGIDMQLNIVERAVRTEIQGTGEWDAYIGWDSASDPFSALQNTWMSGNWTNYNNADFDALVNAADASTDGAERASLVQDAVTMLTADTPAVWLYYYTTRIAVSDNVRGLLIPGSTADFNNTGVFHHLEDLYMLEPK
jgi:peptide/nickel transport system substrate-binding protein